MGAFLNVLKIIWPILLEVAPLILKAFFTGKKEPIDRAREMQKETLLEAEALAERNGDELSKRAEKRLTYLDFLLRERSLRKKNSDGGTK